MFKVIICLLNGRFPRYKFPLKVEGQSPYSIIICILCSVAMNCIIQDHVYNVQLAALYVPPFYTTTLGWYDWANEATFKHALEICVNLCNYWGPYSVFIASMVMNLNTKPYFYDMFSNQNSSSLRTAYEAVDHEMPECWEDRDMPTHDPTGH